MALISRLPSGGSRSNVFNSGYCTYYGDRTFANTTCEVIYHTMPSIVNNNTENEIVIFSNNLKNYKNIVCIFPSIGNNVWLNINGEAKPSALSSTYYGCRFGLGTTVVNTNYGTVTVNLYLNNNGYLCVTTSDSNSSNYIFIERTNVIIIAEK